MNSDGSQRRRRRRWRDWLRSALPAFGVFVVVAAAAGVAAIALRNAEDRHSATALDRRVQSVRLAVTADTRRYFDAVQDLSVAIAAQTTLSDADFDVITSRIRRDRLPGVGAALLVGPDGEVRNGRAVEPYQDVPASAETTSVDALAPPDRAAVASPEAAEAQSIARSTGEVTASRVLGPGPAHGTVTAVVVGPVFSPATAQGPGGFQGWLMLTLRDRLFLTDTLRQVSNDVTTVTVTDVTDQTRPMLVASTAETGDPPHLPLATRVDPAVTQGADLPVGRRTWRVSVTATGPLVDGAAAYTDEATLAGGLLLAALLAGVTWLLATSRERALAKVEHATAALRADIAHRETVEARLRERESELAGFLAVAAHDLKTPLTNVAAYADLLAEVAGEDLDSTCLGFVERISTGTRRMTRLINDLLDFAAADNAPLRPEPVDLQSLIAEVIAEHTVYLGERRPNVEVGPLPTVLGDPGALRRLLDNLLGNAIKYVKHGDTAQVTVGARREPEGWRVEIADRGIGIPPEHRRIVFTAFHRDRAAEGYPGTGLGLAICKRIIDRHGGHIGVESNPGGGSRFWFTLPAAVGRDSSTAAGSSIESTASITDPLAARPQ